MSKFKLTSPTKTTLKHTSAFLSTNSRTTSVSQVLLSPIASGNERKVTLGPNCPIGNGPVLVSIEAEVEYIIQMLSKFQKEKLHSFEVKTEAVEDFNNLKDEFMKDTSKLREPPIFIPLLTISSLVRKMPLMVQSGISTRKNPCPLAWKHSSLRGSNQDSSIRRLGVQECSWN